MIRFGPAGNCDRFYAEGYKASEQAPAWIAAQGLDAYEYAAGHGVTIREAAARKIGDAANAAGVAVSIHAPYYINCGNPEKAESSVNYLLRSAQAVSWMGGSRVIFHPGSPGDRPRGEALRVALDTIAAARAKLDAEGFHDVFLCPETMGRPSQLGTLDEVLLICQSVERTLPTVDFAHLHAAACGGMQGPADFEAVIRRMLDALDPERAHHFHAHFSRIAYTAKGERCHMTFADAGYGPEFSHLAPVLVRYGLEPTIICESRGTQADDAGTMKRIYREACAQGSPDGRA
ncbi:MAG: TIM barrel protein [Clostridia bacterium]|nr:TIM barrel protein [Clostridia bacterium]